MLKQLIIVLVILYCSATSYSQTPEKALENIRANYSTENIYIHFDKSAYVAGETIWYKAYLSSGLLPSNYSSSLYISLLDDSGKIVSTYTIPIINSTANGNIILKKDLRQANYTILAYTKRLLNFGSDHFYRHSIPVYNPSYHVENTTLKNNPSIYFLPEGGNLIGGISNIIAFKSTDRYGYPVQAEGEVVNSKGLVAASFESTHDGMGKFVLVPEPGEKYTATVTFDHAAAQKVPLPESKVSGTAIQVLQGDNKIHLLLNRERVANENVAPAYLLGVINNIIVIKVPVPSGLYARMIIPSNELPSGILQLTVFTKDDRPLCERLLYIDNGDFYVSGVFGKDTVSLKPRGKNVFSFTVKDTVPGSYSVAVTDINKELIVENKETIIGRTLLSNAVKGFVYNPDYYFTSNDKKVKADLDLVMLTSGWRRYNWDEVLYNRLPAMRYKDDPFITLRGTAYGSNNKILKNTVLTGFLNPKDSSNEFLTIAVDSAGQFEINNLLYEDTARLFFQNTDKKNKAFLSLSYNSLQPINTFTPLSLAGYIRSITEPSPQAAGTIRSAYNSIANPDFNKALLLKDVQLVSNRARNKTFELEKRYITNTLFSGGTHTVLDLINNAPVTNPSQNVFEYLKGRLSSVTITGSGNRYVLNFRNSMSLSTGPIPMTIFLDEQEVSSEQASITRIGEVAFVKVLGTGFVGVAGSGGALAIYRKKGSDYAPLPTDLMNSINVAGYTPTKEFFSPDYSLAKNNVAEADERTTLYWNPHLESNAQNLRLPISFYNSDKATKFRIVLTGITETGKLLYLEKIIE